MAEPRATGCCARTNLLELCTAPLTRNSPKSPKFPQFAKRPRAAWRELREVGPTGRRAVAWALALDVASLVNETRALLPVLFCHAHADPRLLVLFSEKSEATTPSSHLDRSIT